MTRDRHNNLKNPTDQQFIKQRLKEIRDAKKAGNEKEAQQLADSLFAFLGWD